MGRSRLWMSMCFVMGMCVVSVYYERGPRCEKRLSSVVVFSKNASVSDIRISVNGSGSATILGQSETANVRNETFQCSIPVDELDKHVDPKMLFTSDSCKWVNTDSSHISKNFEKTFQDGNFKECVCNSTPAQLSTELLPLVALASFVGSGNTWSRHLIERMTGILTGSIYRDRILSRHLRGEFAQKNLTIVVKTHKSPWKHHFKFTKAVVIIRNPFRAIVTKMNFRNGGHVGSANINKFQGPGWDKWVKWQNDNWSKFVLNWVNRFHGPIHFLMYDKIKTNFFEELYNVAWFLDVRVTYRRLWCTWADQEGSYHRSSSKRPEGFQPYTNEQISLIQSNIDRISTLLMEKFNVTLPLYSYKDT